MRKLGIICAAVGLTLALALGFLRTTAWFAAERAQALSEPAEFVVSFFWAGVVLFVVGLILIVRSTYKSDEEATFEDYLPQAEPPQETELIWICPNCGTENPDEAEFCAGCGWQDGTPIPTAPY